MNREALNEKDTDLELVVLDFLEKVGKLAESSGGPVAPPSPVVHERHSVVSSHEL